MHASQHIPSKRYPFAARQFHGAANNHNPNVPSFVHFGANRTRGVAFNRSQFSALLWRLLLLPMLLMRMVDGLGDGDARKVADDDNVIFCAQKV